MNSRTIAIAVRFVMAKTAVSGMVTTSGKLLMRMEHFTNLFLLQDIFAEEKEKPKSLPVHFRYCPGS